MVASLHVHSDICVALLRLVPEWRRLLWAVMWTVVVKFGFLSASHDNLGGPGRRGPREKSQRGTSAAIKRFLIEGKSGNSVSPSARGGRKAEPKRSGREIHILTTVSMRKWRQVRAAQTLLTAAEVCSHDAFRGGGACKKRRIVHTHTHTNNTPCWIAVGTADTKAAAVSVLLLAAWLLSNAKAT